MSLARKTKRKKILEVRKRERRQKQQDVIKEVCCNGNCDEPGEFTTACRLCRFKTFSCKQHLNKVREVVSQHIEDAHPAATQAARATGEEG